MSRGRKGTGSTVKKVLIANRGEIALRAVRACNALDIRSVAVHSEPDATAPHVWAASEAVCIGPAQSTQSYLNADALLHVACATRSIRVMASSRKMPISQSVARPKG